MLKVLLIGSILSFLAYGIDEIITVVKARREKKALNSTYQKDDKL